MTRIWPGKPYPLGASFDGAGVNFAIFSESASRVEVCLFDAAGGPERERFTLPERTANVYHGYLPGLKPGALYGVRAHGPWDPERGLRHNPHKLLVDPYAKALEGDVRWNDALFGYTVGKDDLTMDTRDSAPFAPLSVVCEDRFPWGDDQPPDTPWADTVIYEAHVRGFSAKNRRISKANRGTYAGMASAASIAHLVSLGVTAVELLPIHAMVDDRHLVERGLSNYWGYNTLGFMAPAGRYASKRGRGAELYELKAMVKALHRAKIEVILDVVYNHSAEGNHYGPTLSLKGLDNHAYYRLVDGQPRYYRDTTGCGNSLNVLHSQTLKLIVDSLRYFATEVRVDGFRFDLAPTLAREQGNGVDRLAAFFDILHQDPVLSRKKLIAEPWDLGEGGYMIGGFPVLWAEWNGRYRDSVRRFWRGHGGVGELGWRLTGSSDLYQATGRPPHASINFVTAHDGFTLRDLGSYAEKHNEANGEQNRDGSSHDDSENHGVEGDTKDSWILAARSKQRKNLLATLLLSQGVPMILGGDEMGRTQRGNNNAYCQDGLLSWHDWDLDGAAKNLLDFTKRLLALRKAEPVLRRQTFFSGGYVAGSAFRDIVWLRPDGGEMSPSDWRDQGPRALGFLLDGDAIPSVDREGRRVVGSTLLVLVNPTHGAVAMKLPVPSAGESWERVLDTREPEPSPGPVAWGEGAAYELESRSLAVLRRLRPPPGSTPATT